MIAIKWLSAGLLTSSLFLSSNARADAPDPNFYVFLCFGQSNSEGVPGVEAQDKLNVDPRFRMLAAVDFPAMNRTTGHWYDAVPPLCRPYCGLCPADYFGRTLVASLPANVRVGVVNVSVGGAKIEIFDTDRFPAYAKTAPDWMTGIIQGYAGNPYQHLVNMGRIAQRDGVIRGILLHQGESNTNDKTWPAQVKVIYDRLCKDLDLDPAKTPLLAGELVNADQHGQCASHNEIIATLPSVIPNSYVISSKGCEARADHVHFTPAGYRELGKRYGEQMLKLLAFPPASNGATTRSTVP